MVVCSMCTSPTPTEMAVVAAGHTKKSSRVPDVRGQERNDGRPRNAPRRAGGASRHR